MYTLQEIARICNGKLHSSSPNQSVEHFVTDSRQRVLPNSLFIALKGLRFDGHEFIKELSSQPNITFLVSNEAVLPKEHSFIVVEDTLQAFQQIAAYHRSKYSIPVIGITGSAAKTIIKEWLFQLLSPDFYVVKSPKSYNSQVGVPLSVLQLNNAHELAIFEAGISQINEMGALATVINPSIGILTNIGDAHAAGFAGREEKLREKLKLFTSAETIICQEETWIKEVVQNTYPDKKILAWQIEGNTIICEGKNITLPLKDKPFFKENIGHCIALLLQLGIPIPEIESRIQQVEALPMRLEVVNGQRGNILLNDSYSNDLSGLEICLSHAKKTAPNKPIGLILSSFQESGLSDLELREKLASLFFAQKIDFLILIGSFYEENRAFFADLGIKTSFFDSVNDAISDFDWASLSEQMIVVKGARIDRLEQIVSHLKEKTHQTIWEINLSQLIENLNFYKSKLQKNVKLLVMVKATAYGTEANKIAQTLQQQRVDYLGVAYPDEGVSLRQSGISLPILVMNCSASHFQLAQQHHLTVQVYSLEHLHQLIAFCKRHAIEHFPVHLKLETGMNRLGFSQDDLPHLIESLKQYDNIIEVKGILSHLAVADMPTEIEFTKKQIERFSQMSQQILPYLKEKPILHILNSSGLVVDGLPQFDMVRLGIGLHGTSANKFAQQNIKQVGQLIATISQIKTLQKGDSVGYGRHFIADKECRIATISVGYADGYDRRLGNGVGEVIIHNKRAKTVGAICMDMCMIDVTEIPQAKVGDEVILTNQELTTTELAKRIDTIPYELMTSISTRVQRRFVYE